MHHVPGSHACVSLQLVLFAAHRRAIQLGTPPSDNTSVLERSLRTSRVSDTALCAPCAVSAGPAPPLCLGLSDTQPCPNSGPRRVVPAARKGKLSVEQLPLPEAQQAEPAFEEFDAKWEEAVAESKATGKPPSLMRVSAPPGQQAWRAGCRRSTSPTPHLSSPPPSTTPPPAPPPIQRSRALPLTRAPGP